MTRRDAIPSMLANRESFYKIDWITDSAETISNIYLLCESEPFYEMGIFSYPDW